MATGCQTLLLIRSLEELSSCALVSTSVMMRKNLYVEKKVKPAATKERGSSKAQDSFTKCFNWHFRRKVDPFLYLFYARPFVTMVIVSRSRFS